MSLDAPQPTLGSDELAWADDLALYADEIIAAIREVNVCRAAIHQYAEHGISGTNPDIEHRTMLIEAVRHLKEMWP